MAYNLGRAYHQLGIVHLAVPYYEKVLSLEPPANYPNRGRAYDLKPEAAYNLSLIYSASGSTELAAKMLRTYCYI